MRINAERIFSRKYNRWFGAHNPFGGDLGKARDPYIRARTLVRISHDLLCGKPPPQADQIQQAIVRNIIERFKQGRAGKKLRKAMRLQQLDISTQQALLKADDCPADLLSAFLGSPYIRTKLLEGIVAHKNAPGGDVIIRFCKEAFLRALYDRECSAIRVPDEEREALESFPEYAYRAPMTRIYPERANARDRIWIILEKAKHLTAEERSELEKMLKEAPPAVETVPLKDSQRSRIRDEIRSGFSRRIRADRFS